MKSFFLSRLFKNTSAQRKAASETAAAAVNDASSLPCDMMRLNKTYAIGKAVLTDDELAAVITAAVMACLSAEISCFEIKAIRRLGQNSPVWNRAGRIDRISGKL